MSGQSSAIVGPTTPISTGATGLVWGLVGVAAFSLTLPLTRVAVGGLSPLLIGSGRAVVAALLAALALAVTRQAWPTSPQWRRLVIVAVGVVVGFPVLTSYALTVVPASHGAVVVGVLPAATAVVAVLRTGERPPAAFWAFSLLGAAAAVSFAVVQGGGMGQLHWADLLLFAAVLTCAFGYAEGGLLARELGSWQTVSWALVLASPLMFGLATLAVTREAPTGSPVEWACFGYLAVVSMYLGFCAWYRGLALGPIARVSQVQLVQPVLSLAWAALLLRERIGWLTLLGGVAVIACAAGAVRVRLGGTSSR